MSRCLLPPRYTPTCMPLTYLLLCSRLQPARLPVSIRLSTPTLCTAGSAILRSPSLSLRCLPSSPPSRPGLCYTSPYPVPLLPTQAARAQLHLPCLTTPTANCTTPLSLRHTL